MKTHSPGEKKEKRETRMFCVPWSAKSICVSEQANYVHPERLEYEYNGLNARKSIAIESC